MIRNRRSFLSAVISAVCLAGTVSATMLNEADLIWDFSVTENGVRADGKYKESPENGLMDQTLEVGIDNAPPFTSYGIEVRGRVLGIMTTDAFGDADFRMDRFGRPIGADGRPIGKRLETGDVIRVFNPFLGIDLNAPLVPRP